MKFVLLTEDEHSALVNGLALHSQQIQELESKFETLRLQTVTSATPETPAEEEIPAGSVLVLDNPDTAEETVDTQTQTSQDAVAAADAEHLRLNTKKLPV